jgi:regulator of nonsense transcripts 2
LPLLLPPLISIISTPASSAKDAERDKEDKDRLAKQRPVLRILAELAVVGAWPEIPKGITEIVKLLKSLMSNDPQYANLPLLATFLKYFSRAYLGPSERKAGDEPEAQIESEQELVPVAYQTEINEAFKNYFNTASKTLVKGQVRLLEQDKRNHEAYIKSGEIFEDRQQAYEKMTKAVERLTTGVQNLADLLGLEPPVLPTAATLSKSGLQIVETSSSFQVRDDPVNGGIWDDEDSMKSWWISKIGFQRHCWESRRCRRKRAIIKRKS